MPADRGVVGGLWREVRVCARGGFSQYLVVGRVVGWCLEVDRVVVWLVRW